jgi:hypothetical protein
MPELAIDDGLIGHRVAVPDRPEWGIGTVLRVLSTNAGAQPVHRVSIQFATGHRVLLVPPARLIEPQPELERAAGWLDTLAGRTVDDRLVSLPASVTEFLGTPAQRIRVLAALYEHTEEPASLIHWARRQAHVADPLSHWSRDELLVAYRKFCTERDSTLRVAAALYKQAEGPEALAAVLASFPEPIAAEMRAALRRPI